MCHIGTNIIDEVFALTTRPARDQRRVLTVVKDGVVVRVAVVVVVLMMHDYKAGPCICAFSTTKKSRDGQKEGPTHSAVFFTTTHLNRYNRAGQGYRRP